MMIMLNQFECSDLSNASVSECVSEDGESPIESLLEIAASGGRSSVGAREGQDEIPRGGAEGAIRVDGEGREAHARVRVDVVLVLLALACFGDGDCVVAAGADGGDDGTVDCETARELRMAGDPDVGRSGLGGVEDGTGVCAGDEASGTSDGGDGGGEGVMASLRPAGGLGADERVLAVGVDNPSGSNTLSRSVPGRGSRGAAARAATGRADVSVGADEGEVVAAADSDGGVGGGEGSGSSAIGRRQLDPGAPEVGEVWGRVGVGIGCTCGGDAEEGGEVPPEAVVVPVLDAERGPDGAVDGDRGAEEEGGEVGGGSGESGGIEPRGLKGGGVGGGEIDRSADN